NPTNCDTANVTVKVTAPKIDAVDDKGTDINGSNGGTTVANVLVNDTLNGKAVVAADVKTTFVSSTNPGVTLDGTSVKVAPGTPAGDYTLVYQICEVLNPANCDSATVTVKVTAAKIDAVDDKGTDIIGKDGGTTVADVLVNDTLNGKAVDPADVTTTFVSATNPGVTLDGTAVKVAPGTPAGDYTLVYQICEVLNPANCDSATVTVKVTAAKIDAVDDKGIDIIGKDGGTTVADVLVNDTLNGKAVDPADVTTTFVSATNPGVTLDGTAVKVAPGTPAGDYTLVYQICEVLNPANCDSATVTVKVTAAKIDAVDDKGTDIIGKDGGTTVADVLVNDTLNGKAVDPADVTTTFVSATNAGVTLDGTAVKVAPGTPAGDYTLVYQICEVLNPANCDSATVTVKVTAAKIDAVDDKGTDIIGKDGGTTVADVLVNDTLNDKPVVAADVTTTFVSATNAGVTLDGTSVKVAPGTPAGDYTLVYQICEVLNTTNCDSATVTVKVTAAKIDAIDDVAGPINGVAGGDSGINVLDNDTLNGTPVNPADVV
ncbi:flagellar biosynthesis/type III secretory pathway protein FliH, partial [Flavobacterium sp. 14A]|nr:flagellar biosynthesis/type III secretory pathway protein FliH [Flavobacterium sp. 14A]